MSEKPKVKSQQKIITITAEELLRNKFAVFGLLDAQIHLRLTTGKREGFELSEAEAWTACKKALAGISEKMKSACQIALAEQFDTQSISGLSKKSNFQPQIDWGKLRNYEERGWS